MPKTIVEKLNLHKYNDVVVLGMLEDRDDFAGLTNYDTEWPEAACELIFSFVLDAESLKETVHRVIENDLLEPNGYLYLAYPKKGNKVYETSIHRDDLFRHLGADEDGYVGKSDLKFSRMVGLDEIFTVAGLKRSKKQASTKKSQRVDDYIEKMADIEADLQDTPELLAFYQSLTPGYQKDWARFVYSAKQEATKQKRREEMKKILAEGYKSRDLYRNR